VKLCVSKDVCPMENHFSNFINKRAVVILSTDRGDQKHQGLITAVNETHLFMDDEYSQSSKALLLAKIVSCTEVVVK